MTDLQQSEVVNVIACCGGGWITRSLAVVLAMMLVTPSTVSAAGRTVLIRAYNGPVHQEGVAVLQGALPLNLREEVVEIANIDGASLRSFDWLGDTIGPHDFVNRLDVELLPGQHVLDLKFLTKSKQDAGMAMGSPSFHYSLVQLVPLPSELPSTIYATTWYESVTQLTFQADAGHAYIVVGKIKSGIVTFTLYDKETPQNILGQASSPRNGVCYTYDSLPPSGTMRVLNPPPFPSC